MFRHKVTFFFFPIVYVRADPKFPHIVKQEVKSVGKLIIDGNAVYEIDENCMQKKQRRRERMNRQPWEATGEDRYRSQRKDAAADMQKKSSGQAGSAKTGGK